MYFYNSKSTTVKVLMNLYRFVISLGLYPAEHGIIGKLFYDPTIRNNPHDPTGRRRGKFFNHVDARATGEISWWNKNEPIWATAQKAGIKFMAYLWAR